MLTTNQKGAVAETAIALEAIKLGIDVYRPYVDGRYDLIFDMGHELLRIQCKWAARHGDVVVIRLHSNRRGPAGMIRRTYTREEVDGFAVFCVGTGRCYFLSADFAGYHEVRLRLGPAKNNQRVGVRWAKDYEFAATIGRLGAVAQLGERLAGSQ